MMVSGLTLALATWTAPLYAQSIARHNYLYVACPGIRNYLEYGGHGLLVFDIENDHRFVKRIPLAGLDEQGRPINVKGICGSVATGKIYVSTIRSLQCIDVWTERILWEREYDGGCDRMSISPDGKFIYQPSFEGPHWFVLNPINGDVIARLEPNSRAHNTIVGLSGRWAYLAGLGSPLLSISDTSRHVLARQVGPFAANIRPFTVNGRETRCYVCINELLGFEVGDLESGEKLHRIEVQGFEKGPVKRHGCPSHGIGMTPDEREIWVVDAHNRKVHVFDNTVDPPAQVASIDVRDEPGWITFSLDGRWAYPSTGDVIDVATRKVLHQLTDEHGADVMSEKMLQVILEGPKPVEMGDQFGLGRVR
ncbi:MAG: hypothetical protein D6753_01850 [Planctomycetota bacterium]|nr:MAG: hypothetical protein D6753_01850 [Planctomycetota bacterium]